MSNERPVRRDPLNLYIACALIAVGGLIFALCGLCTLALTATSIAAAFQYRDGAGAIVGGILLYLAVGGLPALGGLFMLRSGLKRLRPPPPPPSHGPKAFD